MVQVNVILRTSLKKESAQRVGLASQMLCFDKVSTLTLGPYHKELTNALQYGRCKMVRGAAISFIST